MRKAFTIIELLISVLILSTSIVFVLQIHANNHEQILYLLEREKESLADSMFVTKDIIKKDGISIDAKELQFDVLRDAKDEMSELLSTMKREVDIPEEIVIRPPGENQGPSAIIQKINLKANYPASYWHIKINGI